MTGLLEGEVGEEPEDQRIDAKTYELHRRSVELTSGRLTSSAPERDDVAQDAWVRALRHEGPLPVSEASQRAWLKTIVRNLVHDRWRRRVRETRAVQRLAGAELPGASPALDAALVAEAEAELVRAAFARLSESQRHVLELRVLDGLSAAEAGERLGKKEAAVRQMQYRALAALRRELEAAGWNDDEGRP